VAMFEPGNDTGDTPGEFQYWVERENLERIIPFPQGYRNLRMNREGTVLAIVTGVGTARSAASIMALGSDPRFDLSKAYWLIAGIAGIDPQDGSIGSAAWAEWLVDGDLAHEIDIREAPSDWPTGYIPLRKSTPYEQPRAVEDTSEVFHLNPALTEWAYQLTKDTVLMDTPGMAERRAAYVGFPNAQRPPFVLKGDNLAAMTYWHGKRMNEWANRWVSYHTENKGNYVTTAMEDTGTAQALTWLSRAGKVDFQRVLCLRTASNFDMQWPGATAHQSLSGEKLAAYSAYKPSLDAAHRVGSRVVHALLAGEGPKPH
ncbi:MAG: purine nucleoside permease, partial [Opitutaceae bacterium]|nr:purine nucleoside permease [Opitutaceae bacterium]